MLQSWHALKLQVGQKQPSRGAGRAGRAGRSIPALLKVAETQAYSHISTLDPDPRARLPPRHPFSLLRISQLQLAWGMRAPWWLSSGRPEAAAGGRASREVRGREPGPEVRVAEVCVGSPAAPLERVGGSSPPSGS